MLTTSIITVTCFNFLAWNETLDRIQTRWNALKCVMFEDSLLVLSINKATLLLNHVDCSSTENTEKLTRNVRFSNISLVRRHRSIKLSPFLDNRTISSSFIYVSPPRGRMNIHNTINMCEQKCISEQYSNRAKLL